LVENSAGLDVTVDDVSDRIAALALQGPTSAAVLDAAGVAGIQDVRYFRMIRAAIGGVPVDVSRTGYTGDLGYEIWMPWDRAVEVWDRLMIAGRPFNIRPAGMLALDVARVEAGLLLIDVDFHSSKKALVESQLYSPYELGLGRLVQLEKRPFIGRAALAAESRRGPSKRIVGLDVEWRAVERLYQTVNMAPQVPAAASRLAVPVYSRNRNIGRATTTAWSPILKKMIALATVAAPHEEPGTVVEMEMTVDAVRHQVPARVVSTPFFNPARKTARPAYDRPFGFA
jgi:aminomethyltransferase